MTRRLTITLFVLAMLMTAACGAGGVSIGDSDSVATATLAPIVSQTPRLTATPVPTRTPIPTFTPVPPTPTLTLTPSDTPTPTEVPPIIGVVNSLQSVNVRNGPGITYSEFEALAPGTAVEVIGQSSDGDWLNVLLTNGEEGWMAARLLRIQPTQTPIPTFTATVDETAVALGTVFPTAVIGGGTVTPTPVQVGVSPTPVLALAQAEDVDGSPEALATRAPDDPTPTPRVQLTATRRGGGIDSTPELRTFTPTPSPTSTSALVVDESVLPVIDIEAINATATALSNAARLPTTTPTPNRETNIIVTPDQGSIFSSRTTTPAPDDDNAGEDDTARPTRSGPAPTNAAATVQEGVDVLAYCDDPSFNAPAPDNLAAGSTIDIFWVWYASSEAYIQDHLNAVQYDIRIDGVPLRNVDQYRLPTQETGTDYVAYWFAPAGPLAAGEHEITYRVTWTEQIFDGYNFYGPGSTYAVEEGSCTFTVYDPN